MSPATDGMRLAPEAVVDLHLAGAMTAGGRSEARRSGVLHGNSLSFLAAAFPDA